jgi:4'-phosphopantetheinyl transferase
MNVTWHRSCVGEVPDDDNWLTDHDRVVLAGLNVAKRRADWRLGRWTARSLVAAVLDVSPDRVEIRAAGDGAPEAFVDGTLAGLSLSLSHRDGVAVAAVITLPARVGIDLETVEPRSDAFVREWLSSDEQAALPRDGDARDLGVLCCWTGKEASAKVLREGLRLDVRRAVVERGPPAAAWNPLRVTWGTEEISHRGWWRRDGRRLVAIVSDPPTDPPVAALVVQVAS